jgi:hypothetical protein
VLDGWYQAYGHDWRRLPEDAEGWSTQSRTGYRFPSGDWWTVPHLPPAADIKDVWEPGRFGWVYDLVRAYVVTGNAAFATAFHDRLASWQEANPPFRGAQWACGQEAAIRALAILHADEALPLPDNGAASAARRICTILGWSGERIADAIGYGLSQRNNHGISEAAGLVHLGVRLRGVHADADRWLHLGQRYLREQIRDQFAEDGWYAQHSFTYLRVALEQALLAQRALAADGTSLPIDCLRLLDRSVHLLTTVVAARSGVVPNHGANDGARVASFSTAEYRDFRPLLTLASVVLGRPLPADIDPDPEVVSWLGAVPLRAAAREDGIDTGRSGWAVARLASVSVFLRAGTYTHRPSHLDLLHLDVRFGDAEVVTDPGTYAYNAPPPWQNGLASAFVHNAPVLDDEEPAERGPRFLWYSWPSAAMVSNAYREGEATLVAEVPGRVRRRVEITPTEVTILDRVLDASVRTVQISWLLHPHLRGGHVVEAGGAEVVEATEASVQAWFSPTYGQREPSRVIRIRRDVDEDHQEIRTVIRRGHG